MTQIGRIGPKKSFFTKLVDKINGIDDFENRMLVDSNDEPVQDGTDATTRDSRAFTAVANPVTGKTPMWFKISA